MLKYLVILLLTLNNPMAKKSITKTVVKAPMPAKSAPKPPAVKKSVATAKTSPAKAVAKDSAKAKGESFYVFKRSGNKPNDTISEGRLKKDYADYESKGIGKAKDNLAAAKKYATSEKGKGADSIHTFKTVRNSNMTPKVTGEGYYGGGSVREFEPGFNPNAKARQKIQDMSMEHFKESTPRNATALGDSPHQRRLNAKAEANKNTADVQSKVDSTLKANSSSPDKKIVSKTTVTKKKA